MDNDTCVHKIKNMQNDEYITKCYMDNDILQSHEWITIRNVNNLKNMQNDEWITDKDHEKMENNTFVTPTTKDFFCILCGETTHDARY